MSDVVTSKAATKAANIAAHQARNAQAKTAAADARAARMHDHEVANLVASLKAVDKRIAAAELHREWNAEEHYAAVAMRAMKSRQPSLAVTVAANDDIVLAQAA